MQDEAAKLAPPPKEIRKKAIQYRETIRNQFQLTEEVEPTA
jgi:hypothetical protein